jgi:hypothetical protein
MDDLVRLILSLLYTTAAYPSTFKDHSKHHEHLRPRLSVRVVAEDTAVNSWLTTCALS